MPAKKPAKGKKKLAKKEMKKTKGGLTFNTPLLSPGTQLGKSSLSGSLVENPQIKP